MVRSVPAAGRPPKRPVSAWPSLRGLQPRQPREATRARSRGASSVQGGLMFNNADEVLQFIGDNKVEFVDVRFSDLLGTVQHFTVPTETFDDKVFTEGRMFDGSSIRGFQQIHESDMLLMPDATTAVMDPFRQHPTLNITFFVHDPLTGEPYSRDPRNVARKAEEYLRGSGIADTAYFGPEAEFYIFDSARFSTSPYEGFYHLDSVEGAWNTGRDEAGGNLAYKPRYKGGYFPVPPNDHY